MTHYRVSDNYLELKVWVKPNAKREGILGVSERGLEIAVFSKPQDGEANNAVIQVLSKYFKMPKSSIELVSGDKSRQKVLRLYNQNLDNLAKMLDKIINE